MSDKKNLPAVVPATYEGQILGPNAVAAPLTKEEKAAIMLGLIAEKKAVPTNDRGSVVFYVAEDAVPELRRIGLEGGLKQPDGGLIISSFDVAQALGETGFLFTERLKSMLGDRKEGPPPLPRS